MKKLKYKAGHHYTHLGSVAVHIASQKAIPNRIKIDLNNMSSDELIDVFAAVTAINNGISNSSIDNQKVSSIAKIYRQSRPTERKFIVEHLSREIVKQNEEENPLSDKAMKEIKKVFG